MFLHGSYKQSDTDSTSEVNDDHLSWSSFSDSTKAASRIQVRSAICTVVDFPEDLSVPSLRVHQLPHPQGLHFLPAFCFGRDEGRI